MNDQSRFSVQTTCGAARRGAFRATNGTFQTPMFMPVGTVGTVKGVDVERISELGAQIILVNTYHLWLRPSPSVVSILGDIHKFTGWKGPILSDSGGFQIFSLKGIRNLTENGVEFQSHVDGSRFYLTPEKSVEIQEELGVDIAMVLDECPATDIHRDEVEKSLAMTLRWAKRSLHARKKETTSLFAITQGGLHQELRTRSVEGLRAIDGEDPARCFQGFAIGGLSVGEEKEKMYEVLEYHASQLPNEKIRYLMGVGTPQDIVTAVYRGVDLFDCVMPTRAGRCGRAFIGGDEPWVNVRNARFKLDTRPLDEECRCIACRNYSRGYLHHLVRVKEMLGPQMLSIHNLTHYLDLMQRIRDAIEAGTFEQLFRAETARWTAFTQRNPNAANA